MSTWQKGHLDWFSAVAIITQNQSEPVLECTGLQPNSPVHVFLSVCFFHCSTGMDCWHCVHCLTKCFFSQSVFKWSLSVDISKICAYVCYDAVLFFHHDHNYLLFDTWDSWSAQDIGCSNGKWGYLRWNCHWLRRKRYIRCYETGMSIFITYMYMSLRLRFFVFFHDSGRLLLSLLAFGLCMFH